MSSPALKFQIYPTKGRWRWRLVARNGKIMAVSFETFLTAGSAVRACKILILRMPKAQIPGDGNLSDVLKVA